MPVLSVVIELSNPNQENPIFTVKYNSAGTVLWAEESKNSQDIEASSITIDGSANAYVLGTFGYSDSVTFGNYTLHAPIDTYESFFVKYDSTGQVLWAKIIDNNNFPNFYYSYWHATIVSFDNGIYLGGSFLGPYNFIGSDTLTNAGGSDIFIAKYDTSGNPLWAKQAGGSGSDWTNSITTDNTGNIYMTGVLNSPSVMFGNYTLMSGGYNSGPNIFVAKYDSAGNVLWAAQPTASFSNEANSITTDINGYAYITGDFSSPYIILGKDTLAGGGALLAKLCGNPSPQPTINISGNTLSSNSASGNQWFFNGIMIPGATYQIIMAVQYGIYTVMVTDANGCYSISAPYLYFSNGMDDAEIDNKAIISPNPFTTTTTLQINKPQAIHHSLTIYNVLGSEVMKTAIQNPKTEIQRGGLPAGIYFWKLDDEKGERVGSGKMVIE